MPEGKVEMNRGRATKFFRSYPHRTTISNGRGRAATVMATRDTVFGGKRETLIQIKREKEEKREKRNGQESHQYKETTVHLILVSFFFSFLFITCRPFLKNTFFLETAKFPHSFRKFVRVYYMFRPRNESFCAFIFLFSTFV